VETGVLVGGDGRLSPAALAAGVVGLGIGEGVGWRVVGRSNGVGDGVFVGPKLTSIGEEVIAGARAEAKQMQIELKIKAMPPNKYVRDFKIGCPFSDFNYQNYAITVYYCIF